MTLLHFNPDDVDADLVVTCTIGPDDSPSLTYRSGDVVRVDDGTGAPLPAIVLRHLGSEVLTRILQPHPAIVRAIRAALWGNNPSP